VPSLFIFPLGLKRNHKGLYVCQSSCLVLNTTVNFVCSLLIQLFIVLYTSHRQTCTHCNKEINKKDLSQQAGSTFPRGQWNRRCFGNSWCN